MKDSSKIVRFNVRDLGQNEENTVRLGNSIIQIFHRKDDPDTANRIIVRNDKISAELLPSKGLSLGQVWMNETPLFWEAPCTLPDTETIDLFSEEVLINGQKAPGFTFLKTLTAGVELYGLKNWGMPVETNGKFYPIHGETSNIPVDEIIFGSNSDTECWIESSFIYRSFDGDENVVWYKRGIPLCRVTKRVIFDSGKNSVVVEDSIENISDKPLTPDCGYHITFRPEEGAKYMVLSKMKENRGGGNLPEDIETWHEAKDDGVRVETGIIHKELSFMKDESGRQEVSSLLVYPDLSGIEVKVPPTPYFQTWFCCGGKGSGEFTDLMGNSIIKKNWDGMGIEIGSSALDHDGNIDRTVEPDTMLAPGEVKTIQMEFRWLTKEKLTRVLEKLQN